MYCTVEPRTDWPEDTRIVQGKLYVQGKLAVSESHVEELLREHHKAANHPGIERLACDALSRYVFPSDVDVRLRIARIRRECLTCQACEPPSWPAKGQITCTVVPDRFMASVSMDVFSMPTVSWCGEQYDCFLLWVDRLTGWMIARPSLKTGLTGERAAHLLLDDSWGEVGVP